MSDSPPSGGGLFDSVKQLGSTVLAIATNRIELFTLELQEEKCRAIELVVLTAAAVVCGLMTVIMVTATVVYLLPAHRRWIALVALSVVYLGATVVAALALRKRLHGPKPFSGTLQELKRDSECFKVKN